MTAGFFLALGGWTLASMTLGLLIGLAARAADRDDRPADTTWLDDQPAEVLSDAEQQRRFDEITARLRHPSQRTEWWA